jgi:hypothetical protein
MGVFSAYPIAVVENLSDKCLAPPSFDDSSDRRLFPGGNPLPAALRVGAAVDPREWKAKQFLHLGAPQEKLRDEREEWQEGSTLDDGAHRVRYQIHVAREIVKGLEKQVRNMWRPGNMVQIILVQDSVLGRDALLISRDIPILSR